MGSVSLYSERNQIQQHHSSGPVWYCVLNAGIVPEKNGLMASLSFFSFLVCKEEEAELLTIPCIKHVCYKIINEGNLRLGDAAGVSIKNWHYNRQTLSLLFISLRKQNSS